jgi:hypothetical protein
MNPATEYSGNPYLFAPPSTTVHQVKQINPATYLVGGQDFGAYPAPNSPLHIFSRNLTPDITGNPEGGHTLAEFIQIMRTGIDLITSIRPAPQIVRRRAIASPIRLMEVFCRSCRGLRSRA